MVPLNNRTQAALIDKKYNRIITLDSMLVNDESLYVKLAENGIRVLRTLVS